MDAQLQLKQSIGRTKRKPVGVKWFHITDDCPLARRMALEAIECARKTDSNINVGKIYSYIIMDQKFYRDRDDVECCKFNILNQLTKMIKLGYTITVADKLWSLQNV